VTHTAGRCRERAGRRLISRKNGENIGDGDEQEKGADKAEILFRPLQANLLNLLFHAGDDDFQDALPAGNGYFRGESPRDQFRTHR